jgi:hypothetical protein
MGAIKKTDMEYIAGSDRNQMQFFALNQMVAEDSWVRVIDLFVDLLPLKIWGLNMPPFKKKVGYLMILRYLKAIPVRVQTFY